MPSVVSEVAVSSHRHLHSGKHASGSSQGRDDGTPFEALLDTTVPEAAPKNEPKADKSDRTERPAPSQRADDANCDPRDPAASADTDTAPEETTPPTESTETQASAEAEIITQAAEIETDIQTTQTGDETAILAVSVEPAVPQPVTAPVIGAAVAIAIATAPAAADAAGAEAASVAPVGETALPEAPKAAPQTAPAQTATPEQLPAEAKPQIAKAASEKPAEGKPAEGKIQAQPIADENAGTTKDQDGAPTEKKEAPIAAVAPEKPAAPAKPKIETDIARIETDLTPREHAAKANADFTQTATLSAAQTQTVHSASDATSANRSEQAAVTVPAAGLAVEIAAQARAGKNRFEIRLDPPELGRIDVRLDMDKDGNVTSRMMVERSDTLDLLRRDAHALERALNQAGLKTADNALEFQLRDQGFANNDNNRQNGREGTQVIIPDDEAAVLDAKRGYGRLLGLGNGLDIRV